jgi:hypothetical protein
VPELSEDQKLLVEWDAKRVGDLFAEACPGAGKTRAIVARFLRLTEAEPRKGIAMLSFTNAAIDEVRSRCGTRPDALLAPNFVGTFDGFINRYITKPLYVQRYGRTPHFLETWDGVKAASFRPPEPQPGPAFQLGWFEFDGHLGAQLVENWIPRKTRGAVRPAITAQLDAVERRAGSLCRHLVEQRGLISCAASRALAMGYLTEPETEQRIGRLLADRFSEVIVDEAQDCGPEELAVLRLLRRFGVSVVAVADLDQSIYEFRRAEPTEVVAFISELPKRLPLNGNYRSSPAICALNNSLRAGSHVETAVGDNAKCPVPVRLLEYSSLSEIAAKVTDVLDVHEVAREDVVFLAHSKKDAREGAGGRREEVGQGGGVVSGIAAARAVLTNNSSTPTERSRAMRRIEVVLRDIAGFKDETDSTLDERWLRGVAIRLAVSIDPTGIEAKVYADRLRTYVKQIAWPPGITPRADLGTLLKAPSQNQGLPDDTVVQPLAFAWGSIHSVKGREFPSVVVALPQRLIPDADRLDVLDHWDRGKPSEARRVLYVGASRAQRLLILAVHTAHRDRVATLLKRDGVLYDLT